MNLKSYEQDMLDGKMGRSVQKAMQILVTLGRIYGAQSLIPVSSAQIAGVSYDNLGEAGLEFLAEMADGGGKVRILTTLNPAGMDVENWQSLGISPEFALGQQRVIQAFTRMGAIATCTCTPYLAGNLPLFAQHIAWSESSAVCFANSVIGARTNREGGPSALASALTGLTPDYGLHLEVNRRPTITVEVEPILADTSSFGAFGKALGQRLEKSGQKHIPFISGIPEASMECLKSFCASLATYGGTALFHMQGITPEASSYARPAEILKISASEMDIAAQSMSDAQPSDVDFASLGCPHLSIAELAHLADLLKDKKVNREFWITTSRPAKQVADTMGYTQVIEASGARFAVDTCCVVAPIQGRFTGLLTDSAKACYYAYAKNKLKTVYRSFDEVVSEVVR